jgi:sugar/nucleoside kinase (ribokinase family)
VSPCRQVVCAGYMPLDVIVTDDGTVCHRAGGTAANVAAILAYLGFQALLAGQAGDDYGGDILAADLAAAGVDTTHIHRSGGMQTPRLIHSVRSDGHSFSYRCPACQRALPRSRPLTIDQARICIEVTPRTDAYFFDRANAATLLLAEHYAHAGATIVFEPSVPANAEYLRRAAAVAHVIKHSDDRSVGGLDDIGVRPRDGQLRIVTHGDAGLELRNGTELPRCFPAARASARDAGGAGDWTTAGLIAVAVTTGSMGSGRIDDAIRFGQALAALSCTAIGARGLMTLTRRTVLGHAKRVMRDGSVAAAPRFPRLPQTNQEKPGLCHTCVLPDVPIRTGHGVRRVTAA